jgi:hypothetical protein
MTAQDSDEQEAAPVFQATITASPEVLAKLDDLDLDLLPTMASLPDGRSAIEAVLRPDQLGPLVAAGATVELKRLIPPRFPAARILSSEQAQARLAKLARFRGQAG